MISLVLKPVKGVFLVTWIKLSGTTMADMHLVPTNGHQEITNPVLVAEIIRDYNNFKQSNLSMDEYFQANILIAKRYTGDFILQNLKFHYIKVRFKIKQICLCQTVIVFRERTNCKKWLNPNTLEVRSPNYPFDYGNNVRCGWDVTAKPGFTTWLRILDYTVI